MDGSGRGRGKRPAHLAFLAGKDEDAVVRPEAPEPESASDRARFVRDEHGELIVIKPGEKELKEGKTAEDLQYEAYLHGRASGAIRAINGYSDGVDRAAAADSASALVAVEREGEGGARKYAPSRAHSSAARFKRPSAHVVTTAEEATKSAAQSMEEAMRRAREASDDDEDDHLYSAAELADKAMAVYNEPVSNMLQRDVHGNDLRLPTLERKLRRFAECFAEDVAVHTCDGKPVLRDFDALRKRYATVFRESGVALRGGWRRRFRFEPPSGGHSGLPTFCLDFERHSSLVTPRPGLALDGSMGVTEPREQDLVVLYAAEGGEISRLWIAPDKEGQGGPACSREAVEASDTFSRFKALVEKEASGAELLMSYQEQPATASA